MKFIFGNECVYTTKGNYPNGKMVVPERIDAIANDGEIFENVTDLDLANVKVVKGDCFNGWQNLSNVKFPSTLEIIGEGSFQDCGLEDISIDAKCVIGMNAFRDNKSLKKVVLFNSELIGGCAFADCNKLQEVKLIDVDTVKLSAFYFCERLCNLSFINSAKHITNVDAEDIVLNEKDMTWSVYNQQLYKLLKNLNNDSIMNLIEVCPKVCLAISSERCTEKFLKEAHESIVRGMTQRAEKCHYDEKVTRKDIALLPYLKAWEEQECSKHTAPAAKFKAAIDEFNKK